MVKEKHVNKVEINEVIKNKVTGITDQYFIDNGYFIEGKREGYYYTNVTEKWRKLFDTCVRMCSQKVNINNENRILYNIITKELLMEVLNKNNMRRKKLSSYVKKAKKIIIKINN